MTVRRALVLVGAAALLVAAIVLGLHFRGRLGRVGPWPVGEVEFRSYDPRARCDACHGAGLPPASAFEAASVTEVMLRRTDMTRSGSWLWETTLQQDGPVSRRWEIDGTLAPGVIPAGIADGDLERATLTPGTWEALVERATATGLFRFEGIARIDSCDHDGIAALRLSRDDGTSSWVFMTCASMPTRHPTFEQLLQDVDALQAGLAWHRVEAEPPEEER